MLSIEGRKAILESGNYSIKYGFCQMLDEGYQSYVKLYVDEDNNILLAEPFMIVVKDGKEKTHFFNREWESYYLDSCFWYESDQEQVKLYFETLEK